MDEANRDSPAEYIVPEGSDIVHLRTCPTLRSGNGKSFRRLELAVLDRIGSSRDRVVACKRCLGMNPAWEPDPLWISVEEWYNRLELNSESK